MTTSQELSLTRRERQILDILYRRGQASVAEVLAELDSAPSYSAVRGLLRVMVEKGYLEQRQDGPRYLYSPSVRRSQAGRSAVKRILETFFAGSPERMVAALLDVSAQEMSGEQMDRLSKLIAQAQQEGR